MIRHSAFTVRMETQVHTDAPLLCVGVGNNLPFPKQLQTLEQDTACQAWREWGSPYGAWDSWSRAGQDHVTTARVQLVPQRRPR